MRDEVLSGKFVKFNLVQTRVFQLNNLLHGQSTFIPLSFDREFTSVCACTIHGSLIDYRFRVKNQRFSESSAKYKDGDTFMENGILVELKYVDLMNASPVNDSPMRTMSRSKKWTPSNIAEYFFFDEYGFLSINEKKIKEHYHEYTKTM